jgi:DNA-binding HxlR family transcriptional regulator
VLDGTRATLIVRELLTGPKRFTELRTGLVTRTSYPEIPPRVEYRLTPAGERLRVVLDTMATWAEQDLPRQAIPNP